MRVAVLTCAFTLACCAASAAQESPCGITSMQQSGTIHYPPIAMVAHVHGPVVLKVDFDPSGKVRGLRVESGQQMLRSVSIEYVRDWQANESTASRECPIVLQFELVEPVDGKKDQGPDEQIIPEDFQHVTIRHIVPKPAMQY